MKCQCGHRIEDHLIRSSGKTQCLGGPAKCDCVCFSRKDDCVFLEPPYHKRQAHHPKDITQQALEFLFAPRVDVAAQYRRAMRELSEQMARDEYDEAYRRAALERWQRENGNNDQVA